MTTLNQFSSIVHNANKNWWLNKAGEYDISSRSKPEMIALMHSELSEALEGVRKGLMDEHLPQCEMEFVELVDAIIRIFDYLGAFGVDVDSIFWDKMRYNNQRSDHKLENRAKEGGKKF